MRLRTDPSSHITEDTRGLRTDPGDIPPRAPYRPWRHTPEGSVPTPETYHRGLRTNPGDILPRAPYQPRRHTTEGSVPSSETYYRGHPRASYQPRRHTTEGSIPTPETQHRGLPSNPPAFDETQHREESSRRADLAMCSVTALSGGSSMTSPEAVT
ncbi:hypothetical protein RHMOL_Rhmol10G0177700 [Rhododendron molle]|uniref:Uncharacterized protein n=1 Tax=Rhododendron molle TaxID=49168 RepID=A0ACC0M3E4_RHOML|nr:hypothetical protein RHMOL_Rhmol10G0177700 [Rhododendron molle]